MDEDGAAGRHRDARGEAEVVVDLDGGAVDVDVEALVATVAAVRGVGEELGDPALDGHLRRPLDGERGLEGAVVGGLGPASGGAERQGGDHTASPPARQPPPRRGRPPPVTAA